MSSPGFFMNDEDLANNRRMAMAQALMQQQPAQGNYGGLANAGNALAGAIAMKGLQKPQPNPANYLATDPIAGMKDQMGMSLSGSQPSSSWGARLGNLFSFGGGQ